MSAWVGEKLSQFFTADFALQSVSFHIRFHSVGLLNLTSILKVYPEVDMAAAKLTPFSVDNNDVLARSTALLQVLPESARKYYRQAATELAVVTSVPAHIGHFKYVMSALTIYPLFRIKYLQSNEILPAIINGKHRLYAGAGYYTCLGINDRLENPVKIGEDLSFGPLHIVYVKPQTLRFAIHVASAQMMILAPGMHWFDDPNVRVSTKVMPISNCNENKVFSIDEAGTMSFVFVKVGYQAVTNGRDGRLGILNPGIHFCEAPDSFKAFVSTQQEHLPLDITALTMDNIQLQLTAALFYRVVNAQQAFTSSIRDSNDLVYTISSQAKSLLFALLRAESYSSIGKRKLVETHSQPPVPPRAAPMATAVPIKEASAPLDEDLQLSLSPRPAEPVDPNNIGMGIQAIVKDIEPKFIRILQETFGDKYGFEIQHLRIEDLKFANAEMQSKILEMSMMYTQLTARESTLALQKKVEAADADRAAQTSMLTSQAEMARKQYVAETENNIALRTAETKAKIEMIKAQNEAQSMQLLAEAEAQATRMKGKARFEVEQKMAELPEYGLRLFSDAQKETFKNTSKIVYTPNQPMLLSPFQEVSK